MVKKTTKIKKKDADTVIIEDVYEEEVKISELVAKRDLLLSIVKMSEPSDEELIEEGKLSNPYYTIRDSTIAKYNELNDKINEYTALE